FFVVVLFPVQELGYREQQSFFRKRLRQHVGASLRSDAAEVCRGSISRHVHDGNCGEEKAEVVAELIAVDAGQHDIRQKEVDRLFLVGGEYRRLGGGSRLEDFVAAALQECADDAAKGVVVINEQDRSGSGGACGGI